MELGEFGVWTSLRVIGDENAAEAAKLVEDLGYGTFWVGGSPRLPTLRPLLEATDRLVIATGIVNVWQYEPAALAAEAADLRADFPGRVLVGIGIGHREATTEYAAPLVTMRAFLDGLDAAESPLPPGERCLAALSPKMLALSVTRALGTHSYFVPVSHTRFAREQAGASGLVAPELACVVDTDATRARAVARQYSAMYLGLSNYTNNLLRFGFTEADLANGGSDRLIDAVVPQGSADDIAAAARKHLRAGADHVCLQPLGVDGVPRGPWTELAASLGL